MLNNFDNSDFSLINNSTIITEKLEMISEKLKEIKQQYCHEKETNVMLNLQYKRLEEEEIEYYNQLPKKEKKEKNNLNDSNINNNEIIDDKDDTEIIYNSLKEISKKITNILSRADYLPPQKKMIYDDINIPNQCINIIYVVLDDTPEIKYKYQTFRITETTKVKQIINCCLNLWDYGNYISNYNLFFMENNLLLKKLDENDNINSIILSYHERKNPQFFFCPPNFKPNFEIFNTNITHENDEKKKNNKSIMQLINFSKRIVGMSSYIQRRYEELKKEDEDNKNKIDIKEDKTNIHFKTIIYYLIHIFFFMFFILSLQSLYSLSSKDIFNEYTLIKEKFEKNLITNDNIFYNNSKFIINQILSIFDDFYYNNLTNNELPYMLISQVKISFYQSTEVKCNKNLINFINLNYGTKDFKCISKYYKYDKSSYLGYYGPYIKENKYQTYKDSNGINPICDNTKNDYLNFFIYTNLTKNNNSINNCEDLFNYYYNLFIAWNGQIEESEKIKIEGDLGIYSDHSVDLYISINYINKKVLDVALNFLSHKAIDKNDISYDYFSPLMNKACLIDFTIYNFFSENYYYISFLFEFSNNSGSKTPKIEIIRFQPNLSIKNKHSKLIDNFRIFFSLIDFFTYCAKICYFNNQNEIGLNTKKRIKRNNKGWMNSIMNLTSFSSICSFIIFLRIFIIKRNNLYQDMNKNEKIEISTGYIIMNNKNYYSIAKSYEESLKLECLLITFLLLRLLSYLGKIKKFNTYFKYIKLSLIRSIVYFLIFFCMICVFSVFSNQIFGHKANSYRTYNNSILSTLEMSISHFQNIYINNSYEEFQAFYIFLFTIIISYFNIQLFFGLYLETYRLSNLKHGNIYEKWKQKEEIEKKDNTKLTNELNENSMLNK